MLANEASAEAVRAPSRDGPLAGRRMLFVAPDDYPAFRVDLVELFSRHLVERGLSIDWSLYRADFGPAGIDARAHERFLLPAKLPGGLLRKLRNRFSTGAVRWRLVWRTLMGDYDLVQVRDYTFWGIPFLIAARLAGKPFVFWMSYPVMDSRWNLALRPDRPVSIPGRIARFLHALAGKLVFYRTLAHADHVVVQSKRMRETVEAHGVPFALMTPVEMGVSTERFNPDAVERMKDPRIAGRRVVGYLSSDFHGRPFGVALGALAKVRAAGHDAVLVCVGPLAEYEKARLAERVQSFGLPADSVISTGRLPLPQALSWIKAADVCICPIEMIPEQEVATPTKLVEYLAMGRPVVASVHYDHNEVLGSSGAGLIANMNAEAFGQAVSRLLADPQWAAEMGARGPAWVRANRDYAKLADRVERLFGSLLRQRPVGLPGKTARQPAE